MKRNTKIILFIVAAVLLACVAIIVVKNNKARNNDKIFSIENVDEITKVFMADKKNQSVVMVKAGTQWIINGKCYASDNMVRDMLLIVKRMKVREPVSKASFNNVISMLATSSVKVEFYKQGHKIDFWGLKLFPCEKLVKAFYVGTNTKDNLGTFMINEGATRPYVVYIPGYRGFLSPYFTADINKWRAHTVFNCRIPQIDSFEYLDNEFPEESYKILNPDSRNFILETFSGEQIPYDTVRMVDLLSSFSDLRYEYVIDDTSTRAQVDSVCRTTPAHVLTLIDKTGKTTVVRTHRIPLDEIDPARTDEEWYDKDRFYAWITVPSPVKNEDETVVYDDSFVVMQYFSADAVLRKLSKLRYDHE